MQDPEWVDSGSGWAGCVRAAPRQFITATELVLLFEPNYTIGSGPVWIPLFLAFETLGWIQD